MKKKSLLILPVLLLALAACNKEEEEEIPADDTPEVTNPSGDQGTDDGGEDDGTQNPPVVEIDERIKVATGAATLTDSNVNPATASYLNQSVLSLEADWDDDDNVVYTVSGTASVMSAEQANVYWNSVAAEGDAFIVLTLKLEEGETVKWQAPDKEKIIAYEDMERTGEEDLILRISGTSSYGGDYSTTYSTVEGQVTFVVTDAAGEEVNHIVDFSNVAIVDSRIVLTTEAITMNSASFENPSDGSLYIESIAVDETSSNFTYTLGGTPNAMSEEQATAFGADAEKGDAYVVVAITLKPNETLTWGEDKSATYAEDDHVGYIVIRVTNYASSDFVISSAAETLDASNETSSVTHTVVFSGLTHLAPVRKAIETAPEGSLGVLDFSGNDKTVSNPDQTVENLNTLFAESWVAANGVASTSSVYLDGDGNEGSTLPFSVTGTSKVLLGAGGQVNQGNNYWQLSTQCIKLSNSPTSSNHVDGSLTLDFGDTAISKVEIEALKWSTSENVTLEVAGTNSVQTTASTTVSGPVSEISAANDYEVETPDALAWEFSDGGVNQITISAKNRVLIFSIAFYAAAE